MPTMKLSPSQLVDESSRLLPCFKDHSDLDCPLLAPLALDDEALLVPSVDEQ